ncbi:MAG: hypothetical protein J6V90_05680 [Treponema sp.]|nr:hypothetical protein [Treponema sp.]
MKVLITGGGCSEKIDDVRSITNFSSGKTALQIAKTIQDLDPAAAIDFLLAESAVQPKAAAKSGLDSQAQNVTVKNFRSCDDLQKLLKEQLTSNSYDLIFHAAAVSDYTVQSVVADGKEFTPGKISKFSGAGQLLVKLKKNPKLLESIPAWAKKKSAAAKLVGFKLTSDASQEERAAAVQKLFSVKNPPDFVISNDLSEITPKSHPCVLWRNYGGLGTIVARGQVQDIVRKIYALGS